MDSILWTVLVLVAIMGMGALIVHALLRFAIWRDVRRSNRTRKALGLPPLSGIHRW